LLAFLLGFWVGFWVGFCIASVVVFGVAENVVLVPSLCHGGRFALPVRSGGAGFYY
jgi:hypothetical protein